MWLFVNTLVSSIFQLILFSLIPFLWWFFTSKKKESFFQWIGIKKMNKSKNTIVSMMLILIVYILLAIYMLFITKDLETATSLFYGLGLRGIFSAIIWSFVQTGLTEEILFRGFLLKRISNRFGFLAGNIIQSILFGLIHGIMFFGVTSVLNAIIIIFVTGLIGFSMGYINEKVVGGSIIPSWLLHGVSNLFSSIFSLFRLI